VSAFAKLFFAFCPLNNPIHLIPPIIGKCIAPTICQSVNLVIRDVAWNSLGRATLDRIDTEDGFELAMATNYLGPFTLTHLLLDKVGVAKKRKSS
jgi:NAD(P)-dependent dehydrogenase (short-subunit alcohol dehydrogenase family)